MTGPAKPEPTLAWRIADLFVTLFVRAPLLGVAWVFGHALKLWVKIKPPPGWR